MNEISLIILEDPPELPVAGSDDDYGNLDLNAVSRALELANAAFATAEEVKEVPDDLGSLREAVNDLSDAVTALGEELYQIGIGIRTGRIAVIDVTA